MKRIKTSFYIPVLFVCLFLIKIENPRNQNSSGDWLRKARIAGGEFWIGMNDEEIKQEVNRLVEQKVNAIETDFSSNLIYSFDKILDTLSRIVNYTHQNFPGIKVFTYIAPLEIVSQEVDVDQNGKVDSGKTSIFTEHPDWLQIGIDGRPAVFYGPIAFWIGPHDEDAWLCPNDPGYKQVWSEWVSRLSETGIDGLYIDVPFFLSNFGKNWVEQWACHCSDCDKKFFSETGYHIPKKVDWNNPVWRKWIIWRYEQIKNFIRRIGEIARKNNPDIKIIVEHWDGMSDAYWTACSPIDIREVSDVRTHEWVSDEGTVSNYHFYSWLNDLLWFLFYRGIDKQTPSWILTYANKKDISACKLLGATVIASGCNFWETEAPDMAGSVDYKTRKEIFTWLKKYENLYYDKSIQPYTNIALYYSRNTLDFYETKEKNYISEFAGLGMILLESHIPFEVIIEEDLSKLSRFSAVIFPNTVCLNNSEIYLIKNYVANGGVIIATGNTSLCNEFGIERKNYALREVFGVNYPFYGIKSNNFGKGKAIFSSHLFGDEYYSASNPFDKLPDSFSAEKARDYFIKNVWALAKIKPVISTNASPRIIFLPYKGKREFFIRILNYSDVTMENSSPAPQKNIFLSVKIPQEMNAINCMKYDFLGNNYPLSYSLSNLEQVSLTFDLNIHSILKFISSKKVKRRR